MGEINPGNVDAIERQAAESVIEGTKVRNQDNARIFWGGYQNAERNWKEKGAQTPYDPPRSLLVVEVAYNPLSIVVSEAPVPVVNPVPEPPWVTQPEPPKPQGVIKVGQVIWENNIWADNQSTVPVGTWTMIGTFRAQLVERPYAVARQRFWVREGLIL